MFIVFEGIDGSGKTTVSNRVAKALRKRGIAVEHVREGGEFAQTVVRRMREFGKDKRNFELVPLAEVLLYLARDAQLAEAAIRPALERADIVFADRYLYSYEVLGADGRGLSRDTVRGLLDHVAGGLWPDLVVLCDVDPHLARARRKARKIERSADGKADDGGGSRKGLAGVGLHHRLRAGYRAIAERERDRWLVVDNGFADLGAVVDRIAELVAAAHGGAPVKKALTAARRAAAAVDAPRAVEPSPEAATEAFYGMLAERAEAEPGVAAYWLSGLDDEPAWVLRERLADTVPATIAYSVRGLDGERAWELRERLLPAAPYQVARSLLGTQLDAARAHAMRQRLAGDVPRAVLATIRGDGSREAWSLRRQLADAHEVDVVGTLAGDSTREAWTWREAVLSRPDATVDPAVAAALARSVSGLDGDRAWAVRREVFDAAPVAALASLAEVYDPESWQWRARWIERAGKAVMATLSGCEDERAWELRRAHADRVKEAVDSISGLDSDEAWALREQCADVWPSTTLKSIVPLARTDRARKLAYRLIARYPDNLSLLKHATRIAAVLADGAALEVVV